METWRLLPYDVGPPERHVRMADALVRRGRVPSLWWHSTEDRVLLLGAGQTLRGADAAVRRHGGGTAVLAGPGVLGLDVMLPAGHPLAPPDVVETYRWLGAVWRAALHGLGVAAHLVTIPEARRATRDALIAPACFGSLSPYEVTVEGRKLVGLAQVRRRNGILLQAGVHQRFDADGLAAALAPDSSAGVASRLRAAATGLDEVGKISLPMLMSALHAALQAHLRVTLADGEWEAEEQPTF